MNVSNNEEAKELAKVRKECDKKDDRLERAKEKLRKKLQEAKTLLYGENLKGDKAVAVSELNL